MIELELPFSPSVNHYKRTGRITTTKSGKRFQPRIDTPATKRFYFEVWMKIRLAMANEGLKSFQGATISVEVHAYPPDNRKRDIDNLIKPLLDAMQKGGLYDDDNQIARLLVQRCDIFEGGKIIVRIEAL